MIRVFLAAIVLFAWSYDAKPEVQTQGPFEICRTIIVDGQPTEVCSLTGYLSRISITEPYNPPCPEGSAVDLAMRGHLTRYGTGRLILVSEDRPVQFDTNDSTFGLYLDTIYWTCRLPNDGVLAGSENMNPYSFTASTLLEYLIEGKLQ